MKIRLTFWSHLVHLVNVFGQTLRALGIPSVKIRIHLANAFGQTQVNMCICQAWTLQQTWTNTFGHVYLPFANVRQVDGKWANIKGNSWQMTNKRVCYWHIFVTYGLLVRMHVQLWQTHGAHSPKHIHFCLAKHSLNV